MTNISGDMAETSVTESQKTRMMELPGRQRSSTISSAVWIECTNVTDGRTDTGPQQRPRLRNTHSVAR